MDFGFLVLAAEGDANSGAAVMLVVYVVIALGVSTLCSLFEAVLLSISPAYVARLEQEGASPGRGSARSRTTWTSPSPRS